MSHVSRLTVPSYKDELVPFRLLFGLDGDQIFPFLQIFLVGWLALMLLPRFKYTKHIVLTVVVSLAAVYTLMTISLLVLPPDGYKDETDFGSLGGIVTTFQDPNSVLIGWIHFLAFDLMVAWLITVDSIVNCGTSHLFHYIVMVPILVCTLFLGPLGFTVYAIVRMVFLNSSIDFGDSNGYRPIANGRQSSS